MIDQIEYEGTVPVKVNGKAVKAGSKRGWKKAEKTSYWSKVENDVEATNPFSGASVRLTPLEATIYRWCIRWYARYERRGDPEAPIQAYDDMKYFLLDINPEAYMELID